MNGIAGHVKKLAQIALACYNWPFLAKGKKIVAELAKLPIGIQTFSEIIEEGYVYIDKTKYIHKLVTRGKVYFLSRPRRFGKSVLISTLDSLFKGRKELFEGLWIFEESDYDWQEYPVIRVDLSKIPYETKEQYNADIKDQLLKIAASYSVDLEIGEHSSLAAIFSNLIEILGSGDKKVVILIDEYDKPIISYLSNTEKALEIRDVLRNFYTVIKAQDEYIRFVLLTGISKFSKMSVFSGLNNLDDISMDDKYTSIVGCTQDELEYYFNDYIDDLSQSQDMSRDELLAKIKYWYNGYRFKAGAESVYNPFSTLLLFDKKEFQFWWFETATPKFLVDLIKAKSGEFDLAGGSMFEASKIALSSYSIENLSPVTLLYQTGYLTIKSRNEKFNDMYILEHPNYEVRKSFTEALASGYANTDIVNSNKWGNQIAMALDENDLERFFEIIRNFFSNIPYDITLKNEKYYQSLIYCIISLVGLHIEAESRTNKGRIDAVIKTDDNIYIFEFKLNGTKEEALQQIKDKNYADKYKEDGRNIILIGTHFDKDERNIPEEDGWITG